MWLAARARRRAARGNGKFSRRELAHWDSRKDLAYKAFNFKLYPKALNKLFC